MKIVWKMTLGICLWTNALFAQWQGTAPIYYTSGYVGIGTSNPGGKLDINWAGGQIKLSGGTVPAGVWTNTTDLLYLGDWQTGTKGLLINLTSGNVGIGTASPSSKLHISEGAGGEQLTISRGTGAVRFVQNINYDDLYLYNKDASKMYMYWKYDGNVGIGTINPDAKLTVKGTVHAQEVKVDLSVPGPDYVFSHNYKLPTLDYIKTYIDQEKHLPEVPSAKEMEANGVKLGEMNMILLKKIEELTLYVIEANRKIELLQQKVEKIETKK